MSQPRKALTGVVAGLFVLVGLFALTLVLTSRPPDATLYPAKPGEPTVTVYVLSDLLHTDLAVRTDQLTELPGPTADAVAAQSAEPWTHVSWRAARLLQGGGGAFAVVEALFMPGNASVVHFAGAAAPTSDPTHPHVLKLVLSKAGFDRMRARIDMAFALQDGHPQAVASAPGGQSFKGAEAFSILHDGNHWIGQVLNAAGLPITPLVDAPGIG